MSIIHDIKHFALDDVLPIAAAFGVPQAQNIEQAVTLLRGQGQHDQAAQLAARAQDALDQRLAGIEARLTLLEKKG